MRLHNKNGNSVACMLHTQGLSNCDKSVFKRFDTDDSRSLTVKLVALFERKTARETPLSVIKRKRVENKCKLQICFSGNEG